MNLTDTQLAINKLIESGILGALLVLALGTAGWLGRALLSEKDKRIADTKEIINHVTLTLDRNTDTLDKTTNTLDKNTDTLKSIMITIMKDEHHQNV